MTVETTKTYGSERQGTVYLNGLGGRKPALPVSVEGLERAARAKLSPAAFAYIAGGAGGGDTMRANLEAFRRWRLVPRMLRDVSRRSLATSVLGMDLPAPFMLAPIGVQSIAHPDAEVAAARAAAALGLPFATSTAASRTLEDVAAAVGETPHVFQLYWGRNPELSASLLARAEAAGYGAVLVTLDTGILGWREEDIQQAYLPFLQGEGLANYFSDPVFRAALAKPLEEDLLGAVTYFLSIFSNPTLTWEDIAFLREHTRLPIVLKGILHPDDARAAVEYGAQGVVVSNHGGRQVDGAVAALDALPAVADAVAGRATVLFDSGVRRGSDVLKALALGADAVMLGRPYVYGLALGGEGGVRDVLDNFLADLDLALALSGHTSPRALGPGDLVPAPHS